MTDKTDASQPFGAAGAIYSPADEPAQPSMETIRDRLWTNIDKFVHHDLDCNSQQMLSHIVEDAQTVLGDINSEQAFLAEQREEEFEPFDTTFGLTGPQLKGARKGTLSLAPDKERALLNNIAITIYSKPLWRPEQSLRSVAELVLQD